MMTQSRRDFLKASAVAGAVAAAGNVHAAGSDDTLKIGLVGCGGRGTGAASQALRADSRVKLVALADAFRDRLDESLATLKKDAKIADKVAVSPETCFVGFDACKQLIDSGVDVVLLATPPHFRPAHLKLAIDAGKHVFCEKPVAVDAPGVRSVIETCKLAKEKNLSVVSGLCLRYDNGFVETIRRIHDGAVGDIVALRANDYRGGRWAKKRQSDWSDMTYHMRNWYNFTWLSGDFNVEQHVHFLDVCAWAMKDQYPVKAIGMGGRQVLTGPEYGNIYDHFSIVYEYANGAQFIANTRQHRGCKSDLSAMVFGSKGQSLLSERRRGLTIKTGSEEWLYNGPGNDMYQTEHDRLFAAIRKGQPINNGDYMSKSTLLAILGRMVAYTGQEISWEKALNSKEDLSPPRYDWEVKLADPPVAVPGVTKFA
jgi:predicted dehydrogenase